MPLLDVSEVIDDPDFADTFEVIRRVETVNSFGESTVVEDSTEGVSGVVCMASPEDLERLAEEDRQHKVISVVTRYRLRGVSKESGSTYKPDIILWAGSHYEVKWIDDYTHYGTGFVEVLAGSIDYVDPPPE